MKKIIITTAILISFVQSSIGQYSVDWGKYINEPVPNADFSFAEQSEQLVVDVKNAATNEEYVYVTGRTLARSDQASLCGPNKFYYGAEDNFIAKYDRCGNLQWFRFIGTDNNNEKDECGDFAVCLALDKDPLTDSTYIYAAGYSFTDYDPVDCPTCLPCGAANSIKAFSCIGDTCIFQKTKKSEVDAFVAKYDENGNLLKWTYFGGDGDDIIIGMSIFQHDVYITGTTASSPGFLPASTPKFDSTLSSESDAFVARLDDDLCKLKFFSYMGGPEYERSHAIRCFKTSGTPIQFYISGATAGDMADASYKPLNSFKGGSEDSFLSLWKLNKASGVFKPQWVTYIGGKANDRDREMIIDKSNNAIITGLTHSIDFISGTAWTYPKSNFYDTVSNGMQDAFVAKFDVAGNGLWGTYFGGSESEGARGLARYALKSGVNYVAISGGTKSNDMPTQLLHPPFQAALNGGGNPINRDAFVAIFTDPQSAVDTQQLEFSSYFGGKLNEWDNATVDYGPDIELGGKKEIYLTFYTRSVDIENCISSPGYHHNTNTGGDQDGFLAKILNSSINNQFDCMDFDWGTSNPGKTMVLNTAENKMKLYPNPTAGKFTLHLKMNEAINEEATIEILNVYGQKVYLKKSSVNGGVLDEQISVSQLLMPGVYFVRVTVSNNSYMQQLICQE